MPEPSPHPLPNPLLELHRQVEAEFQPYAELEIVSTFGQPQAEYAALHKGAGLMDQPQRGLLEVSGVDRHAFVNNLVTNQLWDKQTKKGLTAGEGCYAFYLNTKGRIVADLNAIETGDRLLLEMDARLVEPVRQAFDKYRFAEKVTLTSRVGQLHQLALYGPGALALFPEMADLALHHNRPISLAGSDMIAWRDDPTGSAGCHLIVPTEKAAAIWTHLLERSSEPAEAGKRALRPVGWAAFNATRIEAGRPLFAIDFDDTVLPAETGQLDRAVSFTKGCYLGQEIVARMHARGQAARQICGIRLNNDSLPLAGSLIYLPDDSTTQIGGITSSTLSPVLSNAAICLGFLRKGHTDPGTAVKVPAEGAMREARVVELPFIAAPL